MITIQEKISEAADFIRQHLNPAETKTGLVLGSGLGSLADDLASRQVLNTQDIPHWPKSTVPGHAGRVVAGYSGEVPVIALQGRVHYYEGYSMEQVVFPVRVLGALGIRHLIVTNAAGGLNSNFIPGDLMLITDHINLMGTNPLIGYNDPNARTRFPDMSMPYSQKLRRIAVKAAEARKIPLREGVLCVVTGPSYETAAEVQMMRLIGGDAVCMSTVPEVIAAVQMGLSILGISCITNPATGLSDKPLSHDEVKGTAKRIQAQFTALLKGIIETQEFE